MKYVLTISFALAFLGACKKNDDIFYPIPANIKSLITWRLGSYWLMRDSLSGEVDSFYVNFFDSSVNKSDDNKSNEMLTVGIREVRTANSTLAAT